MIFKKPLLSIAILLFLFAFFNILIDTELPYISNLRLNTAKIPNGSEFKILQLSDLHGREFGNGESYLLKLVKRAKPDIITITGDYADVGTKDFTNLLAFSSELVKNSSAVYYVPGNHEQANPGNDMLYKGLKASGVKLLFDTNALFVKNDMSINICGIDYPFGSTKAYSGIPAERAALDKALKGVDESMYTILLSHSPKIADTITGKPCDLILSGHTHGGQVRIPFIGGLTAFDNELFGSYDRGLFKMKGGLMLYVDSGLGTSVLPFRFCDRAEMTLITLRGGL